MGAVHGTRTRAGRLSGPDTRRRDDRHRLPLDRPARLKVGTVPPVTSGAPGSDDATTWTWERVTGPLPDLVTASVPPAPKRTVRVVEPIDPGFVLGSTQPEPARPTVPLARRRSGGGGVLVVPGELLWVEILVPRGDPWWDDDVARAAHPIGEWWAGALIRLGEPATVHTGALTPSSWSSALCFAGLGPGEVLVGGRKVVGIAQRRTRDGACFQCAVPVVPQGRAAVLAAGLVGAEADRAAALLDRTAGFVAHPADAVRAALANVAEADRRAGSGGVGRTGVGEKGGSGGEMVDRGPTVER